MAELEARRLRAMMALSGVDDVTWADWGDGDVELALWRRGHSVTVKGFRDANEAELISEALLALPSLLDTLDRQREALEEIADKLACDEPCNPRETTCRECGFTRDHWCAGCIARRALGGDDHE